MRTVLPRRLLNFHDTKLVSSAKNCLGPSQHKFCASSLPVSWTSPACVALKRRTFCESYCHVKTTNPEGMVIQRLGSSGQSFLSKCKNSPRDVFGAHSRQFATSSRHHVVVHLSEEVREAVHAGKAVVALESTIITHGMPYPENV
ncbi:hypothetical protein BaRGS_00032848, partial [Batillaria attramentaria]